MRPRDFKLERFLERYEFTAPYLLCCSDCEAMRISDLLKCEDGSRDEFLNLWLGYTESQGSSDLRKEIACLYQTIQADQVLVHSGAEEAIFNFAASQLKDGDHVVVQWPCYQSLAELPAAWGCRVSFWKLRPGEKGWQADVDELRDMVTSPTRLIILNSPHNPTGHLFSPAQWQAVMDLAASRDILVLADEVYKYLEYDQRPLPWACDLYENAVSLGVMSKSFGLPGLRIGWVATRNRRLYQRMASFKDYTTICNSAPSEYLAALALRHRAGILKRNREMISRHLARLDDFMARHEQDFIWLRPMAGPIAFPAFRRPVSSGRWAEKLVERSGILLLPGGCYDYDDRFFRIGLGRADFPEVLERLEQFWRRNGG